MPVIIDVDQDSIELSDDHDVRVGQLSSMLTGLMLNICDETDTNFCDLAADLSRQLAGNMLLNGHVKCATTMVKEMNDVLKFMVEKQQGETAH